MDYSALLTNDQKKSILEQRIAQFASEAYQHAINKQVAGDNAEALKAANAGWTRPPSSPTPPSGGMSMPSRPSMPSMPGMGMGMPSMPSMPVNNAMMQGLEPGDPVNRNTRND
jgi:hypothetical protein